MEKSVISYIVAAVAAVIGIILIAWFMVGHPDNKDLFIYGSGAMFCITLVALLVGLKFRLDEKEIEKANERKRCNP